MTAHPSARILLIDDEPGFVNPLVRLLCRDGYSVETAVDGQRALAKLQEAPYDLLLCDLRMPELDGPALYAILTQQSPHRCQHVIFLTGDTLSTASRAFLEQCGQPWLPKPCSATQVRQVIEQVLGGSTLAMQRAAPEAS